MSRLECDLVFNLSESFGGNDAADVLIAGYLDLLNRPYTGAGVHGLMLAQDKAVAKKIFAFHGIHTPVFAKVFRGRLDFSHHLEFPVIVKPAREDGSIGIEFNAVVNSIRELMERIDWLHQNFDSPVMIEEYVEGREMYVGVIGNETPTALPIVELDLSKLPEGRPRIAGAEVKWGKGTHAYRDTKSIFPEDLSEDDDHQPPADGRGGLSGARSSRLRPRRHAAAGRRTGGGHRSQPQSLAGVEVRVRDGGTKSRADLHRACRARLCRWRWPATEPPTAAREPSPAVSTWPGLRPGPRLGRSRRPRLASLAGAPCAPPLSSSQTI